MSTTVAALLERCRFPSPGLPIDCAVSGGADSLALLVLASEAGCVVTAFHVDHGLRDGSEHEGEVVRRAAQALGCGFVPLTVECPPGPNLEARARAARFAALPDGVATGHTADDQAETVVLNLLRGSGIDGAAAIRPGREHPILDLRRAETEAVVAERGLAVVTDPSNTDPSFRRNRVRHELIPLMREIADRDVVPLLARFAAVTRDEVDLLDQLAGELNELSIAELRAAPLALRRRAVRRLVRAARATPYAPDLATVERTLAVIDGTVRATEIGGGFGVRRSAGRLVIVDPSGAPGHVR
ncbi:MAG TPA: tRNA lysidine(34) synthetase TilS [Acidimicrobiales bacterium]|nr:tRNA lysidine(34) synthetase TilS [Acidimicrobiales bacterium]